MSHGLSPRLVVAVERPAATAQRSRAAPPIRRMSRTRGRTSSEHARLPRRAPGVVAEAGADQGVAQVVRRRGHRQRVRRRAATAVEPGPAAEPGAEELAGHGLTTAPATGRQAPGVVGSPTTAATDTAYEGMP